MRPLGMERDEVAPANPNLLVSEILQATRRFHEIHDIHIWQLPESRKPSDPFTVLVCKPQESIMFLKISPYRVFIFK